MLDPTYTDPPQPPRLALRADIRRSAYLRMWDRRVRRITTALLWMMVGAGLVAILVMAGRM